MLQVSTEIGILILSPKGIIHTVFYIIVVSVVTYNNANNILSGRARELKKDCLYRLT